MSNFPPPPPSFLNEGAAAIPPPIARPGSTPRAGESPRALPVNASLPAALNNPPAPNRPPPVAPNASGGSIGTAHKKTVSQPRPVLQPGATAPAPIAIPAPIPLAQPLSAAANTPTPMSPTAASSSKDQISARALNARSTTFAAPSPTDPAANQRYQRAESVAFGADVEGSIEGWMAMQSKSKKFEKKYLVLDETVSMLRYYKTLKDRQKNAGGKIIELFLASIKPIAMTGNKFTWIIITRIESYVFKAETQEEMEKWVRKLTSITSHLVDDAIEDEKRTEEDSANSNNPSKEQEIPAVAEVPSPRDPEKEKRKTKPPVDSTPTATPAASPSTPTTPASNLQDDPALRRGNAALTGMADYANREENQHCADCSSPINSTDGFVSTTLGLFICKNCATSHLEVLGKEISSIFAVVGGPHVPPEVEPFVAAVDPLSMTFVGFMGNSRANDYWEAKGVTSKPTESSSDEERAEFIKNKYLKKLWRGPRQGFINVRDEKKKKWKKTWMVVENSTINMYNDPKDMKAASIIFLASCGVKLMDDPTQPECFSFVTPQRVFKLQAQSVPEAIAWANAIKVAAASTMHNLADDEKPATGAISAGSSGESQSKQSPSNKPVLKPRPISAHPVGRGKILEDPSSRPKSTMLANGAVKGPVTAISTKEKREKLVHSISKLHLQASMVSKHAYTGVSDFSAKMKEIQQIESDIELLLEEGEELQKQLNDVNEKMKDLSVKRESSEIAVMGLQPREEDLASNPTDDLVKDSISGTIIGGSVEALIYSLINGKPNQQYVSTFMQTYRTFTTTSRVLMELAKVLRSALPSSGKANSLEECKPIANNVIELVVNWIVTYFDDLEGDSESLELIMEFAEKVVINCGLIQSGKQLHTLMRNQMISRLNPPKLKLDDAPAPIMPPTDSQHLSIEEVEPLEVARQMCLIDHRMFMTVKPREFLVAASAASPISSAEFSNSADIELKLLQKAPNLSSIQRRYAALSRWALTTIIKQDSDRRPAMLERFISIANELKNLRNYQSCMAIMSAVESTCILRFEGTWERVSAKVVPLLLELRKLMSPADQYHNLKAALYQVTRACVPFLEAYIADLRSLDQYPDILEIPNKVVVNFDKRRSIARIISEIRRYQAGTYSIESVPRVQLMLYDLSAAGFDSRAGNVFAKLTELRETYKTVDLGLAPAPPAPLGDAPLPPPLGDAPLPPPLGDAPLPPV